MQLSVFFSLVAYACATTFSPGPNNVLLLSSAGRYGFKKCLPLMRGIWTGLITVMLICGFGCAFLGDLIPFIEKYARFVGAAYILWLGYKTLTRRPAQASGETASSSPENKEKPLSFVNGFLLQFLNVKILMLGIAAVLVRVQDHAVTSIIQIYANSIQLSQAGSMPYPSGACVSSLASPRP